MIYTTPPLVNALQGLIKVNVSCLKRVNGDPALILNFKGMMCIVGIFRYSEVLLSILIILGIRRIDAD